MSNYNVQCCANVMCRRHKHKTGGMYRIVRTNPVIRTIAKMIRDMADAVDKSFILFTDLEKNGESESNPRINVPRVDIRIESYGI